MFAQSNFVFWSFWPAKLDVVPHPLVQEVKANLGDGIEESGSKREPSIAAKDVEDHSGGGRTRHAVTDRFCNTTGVRFHADFNYTKSDGDWKIQFAVQLDQCRK